ncbi:hypothetical protein AVEN_50384-1 [Araneus ventricosus]|uniref:Uncharacterized protein n=1 Tax=Araneus ventricosus TaxID=182803 RepID=A0A4Y2NFB4_ARAVE|nr:hypothetical protein AVEN_50384-1 [Araneus ventricosus]
MENGTLFNEYTKRRKQEKQLFYNLATQTESKSLILKVTALSVPLGAYVLISSHRGQNSKEIERLSDTFQRPSLISVPPGFYTFSNRMSSHIKLVAKVVGHRLPFPRRPMKTSVNVSFQL